MSSSQQEAVLHLLAAIGFGKPWVFEPDSYRKGSGVREPADLAWISGSTAILLNMQESNKSFERQSEHNLRQLVGWVKTWRKGQHLTGSNDVTTFDISYADVRHIVLISIVSGDSARLQIHPDRQSEAKRATDGKVACVASVPDALLYDILQRGGTALDLVFLLEDLSELGNAGLGMAEAARLVCHNHSEAIEIVRREYGQVEQRDDDFDTRIAMQTVNGLRAAMFDPAGATPAEGALHLFAALNDITWSESAELMFSLTDIIKPVESVPKGKVGPRVTGKRLQLGPYDFFLLAMAMGVPQEPALQPLIAAFEEGAYCIGVIIIGGPEVEGYSFFLAAPAYSPVRAIDLVLTRIAEASAVP